MVSHARGEERGAPGQIYMGGLFVCSLFPYNKHVKKASLANEWMREVGPYY